MAVSSQLSLLSSGTPEMTAETAAHAEYLEGLNEPQREAVLHFTGPILVSAGAGSGKTRVLTRRIAHLILSQRVSPRQILAVTFTNKAAAEMRERVKGMLGDRAEQVWISTFHSAGLRILRRWAHLLGYRNDFVIYDSADVQSLVKKILKGLEVDTTKYTPRWFCRVIDSLKNRGMEESKALKPYPPEVQSFIRRGLAQYRSTLKESHAMDFGDLLCQTLNLLREHQGVRETLRSSIRFLLVDEFQDTNPVQYELLSLLLGEEKNLFAVGDDDQSIYAFRGATVDNMNRFGRDFPEAQLVALEQNYRSTGNILRAANQVVAQNSSRQGKTLWTSEGQGEPIAIFSGYDESDEARFIASELGRRARHFRYDEMAVFYRTNSQSRSIEEALVSAGIPYKIYGGLRFYERREVKDVLSYLRFLINPSDSEAFYRIVNTPPRGIGPKTVEAIAAQREEGDTYLDALARAAKSVRKVKPFYELIKGLSEYAQSLVPAELISLVVEETGLGERYRAQNEQTRLENLEELAAIARELERHHTDEEPLGLLASFLDRVSLSGSDEETSGASRGAVSLMTLHLAKGLEFPVVIFSGVEEGLVPHHRTLDNNREIEEERRLCYVGMTRAMKSLCITWAQRRGFFGARDHLGSMRNPSRFLDDIPAEVLQYHRDSRSQTRLSRGGLEYEAVVEGVSRLQSRVTEAEKNRSAARVGTADELLSSPALRRPPAKAEELSVGVAVVHPSFGEGRIRELEGDPGDKMRVTVEFRQKAQTKRLIFKYAKLRLNEVE